MLHQSSIIWRMHWDSAMEIWRGILMRLLSCTLTRGNEMRQGKHRLSGASLQGVVKKAREETAV